MEKYFRGNEGYGGMFCDRDKPGSNFDSAFKEIEGVYNKAFEDIGGKYIRGKNEDNCVVRVPHTVFFEVCDHSILHCDSFIDQLRGL